MICERFGREKLTNIIPGDDYKDQVSAWPNISRFESFKIHCSINSMQLKYVGKENVALNWR